MIKNILTAFGSAMCVCLIRVWILPALYKSGDADMGDSDYRDSGHNNQSVALD